MRLHAGADGCPDGWLCVLKAGQEFSALVVNTFEQLLRLPERPEVLTIDVPIGLPEHGARRCDLEARKLLKKPRSSSVFAAPVRACLGAIQYQEACEAHREADGRALSKQAHAILPKIREVDAALSNDTRLQDWILEVHPEVCFAVWNSGRSMAHKKASRLGRGEREALIEETWPEVRDKLASSLQGHWNHDDLNDALAAVWTADRIAAGVASRLPSVPEKDSKGLRMEMFA